MGFDAVSIAAEETRDPNRALPLALIGSLAICTVFYLLVAVGSARSMGLRSGIDAARPNQVSDELEAERFGELGRRRCHFPLDE